MSWMVLLGIILVASTCLLAGGLMVITPARWFRLLNWWNRHIPGVKPNYDIDSLDSPSGRYTLRASGLIVMLISLFFLIGAGKAFFGVMGFNQETAVINPTPNNAAKPNEPSPWWAMIIGVPFLLLGIGLLCKPIATMTLFNPHTFSATYLSDPRAAFGFRILGAGFVIFGLLALWLSLRNLF